MTEAPRRGFVAGSMSAAVAALLTGCAIERPDGSAGPDPVRTTVLGRPAPYQEGPVADGNEALELLLEGNERYVGGKTWSVHEGVARRKEVAKGQHPFATVLTCVDSRVPPELVFDRGLGDLVVVRSAGGVLDKAVLGSLEFGVAELKTPLLLVLGHERCGAVSAAVSQEGEPGGSIGYLVDELRPAVDRARKQGGDVLDHAVTANVQLILAKLRKSSLLTGGARLAGARYDLDTGRVGLVG